MQLHRAEGVLDLSLVRRQRVAFLGLGSLGSLTLANMTYPFAEYLLVDPDELEESNIERHLLGRSSLGRPKVEGCRDWLIDRGVDPTTIIPHHGSALDVLHELQRADLLLVNIDKRSVREEINQFAVHHAKAALYGGVYPRGTGGHIMVIPTPGDICYQCAEYRMGGSYEGHIGADYGIDPHQAAAIKDLTAVPALKPSVASIAALEAYIAIEFLKGGGYGPQVIVQALAREDILVIGPGTPRSAVVAFLMQQAALGLEPTWRGQPQSGDRFILQAERSMFSLTLEHWAQCPVHGASTAIEDI